MIRFMSISLLIADSIIESSDERHNRSRKRARPGANRRRAPAVDRRARGARRPRPGGPRALACWTAAAKTGPAPAADAQCGRALLPARKMGGRRARGEGNARLRG